MSRLRPRILLFIMDYRDVRDPLRWVPRLVSHAIKLEFEFMSLTPLNFVFQCPLSLELFLDQLSEDQLCRLRRISFIYVCLWPLPTKEQRR